MKCKHQYVKMGPPLERKMVCCKCFKCLGDFLVFIDLKVVLPIQKWSNAISENFFNAFSNLFQVGLYYFLLYKKIMWS